MRVPTSIWLFLVLTVLTCVVAYWADNLGKNLGKKRISLFNLRPRQTATLLSMASSVAIMLLTLLVLTLFSQDFRDALLRSDKVKASNDKLRRQNTRLENQAESFNADLQQLQKEVEQSRKARQAAATARNNAQRDAAQANESTRKARRQLASTRTELTSAESSLNAAKSAAQSAGASLAAARQNEKAARANERNAQSRFRSAQRNAKNAETQARSAETQARSAGTLKTQAQRLATKARLAAEEARAELRAAQGNLRLAQANFRIARAKTTETIKQNVDAQLLREQLELQINDLKVRSAQIVNAFVSNDILVTVGQVFAERIIEPGQSARELQAQLNALQNEAAAELRQSIGASGAELLPLPVEGREKPVEAEELQRILIASLRESETPVAVRWVAARNHARSERQIDGRLVPIPVQVVAPTGTVLAQETIAGGQSDAQVFSRLLALTDDARIAARARGVTPPLSPQMQNFFAAGTNDRVFAALRDIQSRPGAARVRLIADAPLTTVAPPQIRFVLEDATESDAPREDDASTRASSDNSATPPLP